MKFNFQLLEKNLRMKIYSFVSLISIILFLNSIWEIKWVVVDVTDFLGLASHLTLSYWLGLILITSVSVSVYLDKTTKSKPLLILILLVVGLYLFGLGVLAEQNARFSVSYYPAAEVKTILATSHIDTISKYPLISYRCWPAFHIISAYLLYMTGLELSAIVKYMPFFWYICAIFLLFTIGKYFDFSLNNRFLICYLFLSSFWLPQYYYSPQSFAIIAYLLLFLFLMSFDENARNKIIILLTFLTLVTTHLITSVIIIISSLIRAIYKRNYKLIFLLLIAFIAWYIFLAPLMFKMGLLEFKNQAFDISFLSVAETSKFTGTSEIQKTIINFRLAYLAIYLVYGLIALAYYIKYICKEKKQKFFEYCSFWLVGAISLLSLNYGFEQFERVYMFSLVPIIYIIIRSIKDHKFLVILMILVMILHIPAHYGSESFDQILTTELEGSKFFALKVQPHELFCYNGVPLVWYFSPEIVTIPFKRFRLWSSNEMEELGNVRYIIDSKRSYNLLMYYYDFYPVNNYVNNANYSLIYDNKLYKIYRNILGSNL